jgi:signal peptidase I
VTDQDGEAGTSSSGARRRRNTLVDYVVIAVVAIGLALVIQAFLVKPYRIPSPSMVDTLQPGDRVLVNRLVYHLRPLHRRDIVVFRYPLNTKVAFIKRVVGLPGDKLLARNGKLYVNGVPQNEPYVHKTNGVTDPTNPAGVIAGTTMTHPWSLSQEYTVPPDHFFVMGDNRLDSDDSRVWGPVPMGDLIGEGFFIYWPLDRVGVI